MRLLGEADVQTIGKRMSGLPHLIWHDFVQARRALISIAPGNAGGWCVPLRRNAVALEKIDRVALSGAIEMQVIKRLLSGWGIC